jgi:sec-independent protein translocase protein TatB
MFDSIGFQELVVIGIIALMVVGPKELPLLMRKAGQCSARLRGMAADFRANFDEMARQAELDELRKEVEALRNNNPLQDIKDELTKPFETGIDPYAPVTPYGSDHHHQVTDQAPVMEALPAPVEAKPKRARKPKAVADVAPDVVADLEVAAKPKRTRASRGTKEPGAEVA